MWNTLFLDYFGTRRYLLPKNLLILKRYLADFGGFFKNHKNYLIPDGAGSLYCFLCVTLIGGCRVT